MEIQDLLPAIRAIRAPSAFLKPSESHGHKLESTLPIDAILAGLLLLLLAGFPKSGQLERVLSETWVQEWQGWHEARTIDQAHGGSSIGSEAFGDLYHRFLQCVHANVTLVAKSDRQRTQELRLQGLVKGEGLVFASSSCLIGSLLQCMVGAGLILESEWFAFERAR